MFIYSLGCLTFQTDAAIRCIVFFVAVPIVKANVIERLSLS